MPQFLQLLDRGNSVKGFETSSCGGLGGMGCIHRCTRRRREICPGCCCIAPGRQLVTMTVYYLTPGSKGFSLPLQVKTSQKCLHRASSFPRVPSRAVPVTSL